MAAPRPPPTTAPSAGTANVVPTWRLVEAIAAATPACAGGMPETAVLVIGGVRIPDPSPKTTYAPNSPAVAVVADSSASIRQLTVSAAPPPTSDGRAPRRLTSRP